MLQQGARVIQRAQRTRPKIPNMLEKKRKIRMYREQLLFIKAFRPTGLTPVVIMVKLNFGTRLGIRLAPSGLWLVANGLWLLAYV